ncbi:DUF4411 family protein [Idiomarina loihiensis]|uniref:DUF4411 family protein n=1 Tax=Idiomarina TaxID=135575 RepID=UPI000D711A0F|nr:MULTISPECIES: DUF4411 family protein [Idiomarina]MRJ45693.1 DUF4411 family protein [Idiomarina loihiensis]PWW38454.1 uncharacterized protein DUF4411 [Idiomarina loihiensis]TDP48472.1 uncharacterized protein DUF4411 [Idiomarina loihiensis]TDS23638.1 uncharacterized protein DUF4411 [Idiomarina sp. H2]UTW32866.1 DUF4411 family protein [Idiomarina loihiensis]
MIYLLDANSFIQAKNLHYRMEVVPGFWEWLLKVHETADIRSIDHVYDELTKSNNDPDELHKWSTAHKAFFKDSTSIQIQQIYGDIANHVAAHPVYSQAEVQRFLGGADPWLIAAARALGGIIVTHEVIVPETSRKVKIPNIAREFDVEWMDVFDLLELTEDRLVLEN